MTNKCTIISQIITLLHGSTLSCHPQTACNQYLATLQQYFNTCTVHLLLFCTLTNKCTQLFHKLSHCHMFRHYRVILRQPAINTLPRYTSISSAAVGNTVYNQNFHRGRYRASTTVASTHRLYIQPPQQTVYTATTQTVYTAITTDCIYSHHNRLYIQPPQQTVFTATTQTVYTAITRTVYTATTQTVYTATTQTVYTATTQTVYTATTTDCIYSHHNRLYIQPPQQTDFMRIVATN